MLVRSRTNNLGIGKIVTQSDSQVQVEYFCSVGDCIRKTLPVKDLQPVQLQQQTRCYIWSESLDRWRMGRIFAREDDRPIYQVDLPDGQTQHFPEAEIYVRCNRPIADPIDILAMKGNDTPYFHDRRLPFVESLIEQRAVSRGMTGLFSANIALYPHQVEVIRRVLEDPIQRYLLADEVGLGKTIEAGAILRQYLLPVLIDFGGVKQVAAQVESQVMTPPVTRPPMPVATRLGKVGYAPEEQMMLGQVYPHSDLYALGVTV